MAFDVAGLADNWDDVLDKEKQASTYLRRTIVRANNRIAQLLTAPLPAAIAGPLRQTFDALQWPIPILFELLDTIPRMPGNPPRLVVTADAWTFDIQKNTSNLPIDPENDLKAKPDGTPGERWTGDAANRYVAIATAQDKPLSALNDVYPKIRQALRDLAFQNWLLIPVVTIAFATAAAGVVAAAAGLEGGPPGWAVTVVAIAEIVVAVLGFVAALVAALISFQLTIAPHISELESFLTDNSAFQVTRDATGRVRHVIWPDTRVDLKERVNAEK